MSVHTWVRASAPRQTDDELSQLTYQAYLDDPAVRHALERDVQRLRREAYDQFIFAPALDLLGRLSVMVSRRK